MRPEVIAHGLGYLPRRPARASAAVWVHAASVGELSSARPLVAALKRRHADRWLLLSVMNAEAYRLAKAEPGGADAVCRLPWDLWPWVGRALDRVRPDVLALVECELWPTLILRAAARGVQVGMVNARIYERDLSRYLRARRLFAPVLRSMAVISAQSEAERSRFLRLGAPADRIVVGRNTKFDVQPPPDWRERFGELRRRLPLGTGPVWVLASTHDGEEARILARVPVLRDRFPGLVLLIAPRHVRRARGVQRMAESLGLRALLWTGREAATASMPAPGDRADVVVLGTMGDLPIALAAADLVFMGGSLVDRGGHNPIEPAWHGKPILMGPSVYNFAEVVSEFVAERALVLVDGVSELVARAAELLAHPGRPADLGRRAVAVVGRNAGGTEAFVRTVDGLVAEPAPLPRRTALA